MRINQLRINQTEDSRFKKAWTLYQRSFPIEERREMDCQVMVMAKEEYHFDLIFSEKIFIGLLLWWDFNGLRYIEHFAIKMEQRSHGYGSEILQKFISESDNPIVLEVEKPIALVQQKRINFYEKLGFHLNEYDYQQPPYSKHQPPLPLLLLSWPHTLYNKEYDFFIQECHPNIFLT